MGVGVGGNESEVEHKNLLHRHDPHEMCSNGHRDINNCYKCYKGKMQYAGKM